jgi:integrase
VSLGYEANGKRVKKKVTASTKTAVGDKLKELHRQLDKGIVPPPGYATYTVRQAAAAWLADGLPGRSVKTVKKNEFLLGPILDVIGDKKMRELTAGDVRLALSKMAAAHSSATVSAAHLALKRTLRHAEASDLVSRNVAALVDTPRGQEGRPSKSLTLEQAVTVLSAAKTLNDSRRPAALMYAYLVLSLLVGVRTEEARALRWDHVELDGDPDAEPPVPPHVAVWRSVRVRGETKTERSRRTLGLPRMAVEALRALREVQAEERRAAGDRWQETGLVFTTHLGSPLDAGTVRKMFKRICKAAGIGEGWTPREMRHTFVSVMSDAGVPMEKIADLVGHKGGSRVTEAVYRQVIRPVVTTGAEVMDRIFMPE